MEGQEIPKPEPEKKAPSEPLSQDQILEAVNRAPDPKRELYEITKEYLLMDPEYKALREKYKKEFNGKHHRLVKLETVYRSGFTCRHCNEYHTNITLKLAGTKNPEGLKFEAAESHFIEKKLPPDSKSAFLESSEYHDLQRHPDKVKQKKLQKLSDVIRLSQAEKSTSLPESPGRQS